MSDNLSRRQRFVGGAALLSLALIGLGALPAAAADVYPPTLPGPSRTTVPPDTQVAGVKISAPQEPAQTQVLGIKLAATGADVLPYVAGAGVLIVGGIGVVLLARRRDDTPDERPDA